MISLPVIAATSPSLAESMRSCMLRAGLSHRAELRAFVLGNPKAWLGTAYHKVLERLPDLAAAGEHAQAMLETRWNEEVSRLQQEAGAHPLNHRFGQPPFWRGYHLVLATLRLRAADLMPSAAGVGKPGAAPKALREQTLTAFGGKLKGQPDLARGDDIIDFKTGDIYETEDLDTPPALKQAYVRQLRLYAYLVHEAAARWPRRGLLYPIAGPPVEVELDPESCQKEAEEAVALLDQYNAAVAKAQRLSDLATPSPEACCWCPYKAICPAFWAAADETWAGQLDGEAIGATLADSPQAVFGGSALALRLTVDAGTAPRGSLSLTPLPVGVHPGIAGIAGGERVRIVGVGRRQDNTLYPAPRMVVLPLSAIPALDAAPAASEPSGGG